MWTVVWGVNRPKDELSWDKDIGIESEEKAWEVANLHFQRGHIVFAIYRNNERIYDEQGLIKRLKSN